MTEVFCKTFILSTLLNNMQSSPYADSASIRYVRKSCPCRSILINVALLRNVQTVQELFLMSVRISSSRLNCCQECLTFRISLFRTLQICWMSAADCETFSSELPYNCSSSFWFFEGSTSTPGCMTTLRTIFSPMKFLCIPISTSPSLANSPVFSNPSRAVKRTGSPPQTDRFRCSSQHSR